MDNEWQIIIWQDNCKEKYDTEKVDIIAFLYLSEIMWLLKNAL